MALIELNLRTLGSFLRMGLSLLAALPLALLLLGADRIRYAFARRAP